MDSSLQHPASFRDPSGFIFTRNGVIFRQINKTHAAAFDQFINSGLYDRLCEDNLLVSHQEVAEPAHEFEDCYKVIRPYKVPVISYPYEWSFNQLKDAALLTIRVTKKALDYGMILKDATPYNIQFAGSHALFIDTLSFDRYTPSEPWVAYRQFCQNFLYPLLLEHYLPHDFIKQLSVMQNGFSASFLADVLPFRCRFSLNTLLQVYMTAKISASNKKHVGPTFSSRMMRRLLDNLEETVYNLKPYAKASHWTNYYKPGITDSDYLSEKERIVDTFIREIDFRSVLDAGANNGHFSLRLQEAGASRIIAADADKKCVDDLYMRLKPEGNIIPLVIDLANPSPACGSNNQEHSSFVQRGTSDLVLALAVTHHMYFTSGLSFRQIATLFQSLCQKHLIVEFVPAEDPKTQKIAGLNQQRKAMYTADGFRQAFGVHFDIRNEVTLTQGRMLFLMSKK